MVCVRVLVSHVSEEILQIPGIFLRAFNLTLMAMARMPAMPHASFLHPASISSSTLHISSELHFMKCVSPRLWSLILFFFISHHFCWTFFVCLEPLVSGVWAPSISWKTGSFTPTPSMPGGGKKLPRFSIRRRWRVEVEVLHPKRSFELLKIRNL